MPRADDPDEQVIKAVLEGEIERYAELVTRYQRAAWKLAFSFVGNMEDAKDVSQNGFVKAYQHLGRFRRQAKFSTWLYRIIVNECKDWFKRRAAQPSTVSLVGEDDPESDGLFEVADPAQDPRQLVEGRELGRRLSGAMARLPMKQRTAFVLHHVHGLSLRDVSEVMGCRIGTVKAHLFRAAEQLRIRLERHVSLEEHA